MKRRRAKMSAIENVSRRGFLKGLGVSSTALVLGVEFSGVSVIPKAFAEAPKSKVFKPNVYVQIGTDSKVSVFVHRSEMGQGIRTSIPMIIADELEADWEQIEVVQGLADKKYGSQNTDGSRSIRQFYQPLREAAASARMMLEQAAAKYWKVDASQCVAQENMIVNKASGDKLPFGQLAELAALQSLPEVKSLVFKSKEDFRFIGKSHVPLVDEQDIVMGTTQFGYDVDLPNMGIAVIARPPVLGGKVVNVDATAAKKVVGVIDVIQMEDIEEPVAFKALGGVAVIAENTWAALKGRDALVIEWEHGKHAQYDSSNYKNMLRENCKNADKIHRSKGDVAVSLKNASQTFTADYYVPELIHVPMEPPAATAHFKDDGFEIWACTQTPQSAQGNVAQATGIAPEKIKVNVTLLGGGFGRKSKPDFVIEAALLSQQLKRPIKVLWTREDEIKNGYYHAVSYQSLTAGINSKGKVDAWQHHAAEPPIGSTFSAGADQIGFEASLGMIDMPFDVPNIRCASGKAPAHTRIGWLRSVTNINHAFAVSSFVDELANESGVDSKTYIESLIGEDRQIDPNTENATYGNYGESLEKYPIDTARMKATLKDVAAQAKWGRKLPKGHGLGIAVHRSFASYVACVVEVSTSPEGKIKLEHVWMSVDCGLAVNPERVVSQMEGAAIFGTSLTFYGELTAKNGEIEQGNFDTYPIARITDIPDIDVNILKVDAPPGGVGEPGVPPVAPAICNAIFNATGKRYRELPLTRYDII